MRTDEAGRGPVVGPMVYAVAYCTRAFARSSLASRGYDDSKALAEEKRASLLRQLREDANLASALESISARRLSARMLAPVPESLNAIAYESTRGILQSTLDRGVNVVECYVDTLGDPRRHKERLSRDFPGIAFTVEPKADATYPIVSAASIVAKVTRDERVRAYEALGEDGKPLPFADGVDRTRTGSGYPSDPATKKWLRAAAHPVFGFPSSVRFAWSTCTPVLEDVGACAVAWAHEEQDTGAGGRQATLASFAPEAGIAKAAQGGAGATRVPPAPGAAPLRSRGLRLWGEAIEAQ